MPEPQPRLTLHLPHYLPPSLNRTNRQHWRVYQAEKLRARKAVLDALGLLRRGCSSGTPCG